MKSWLKGKLKKDENGTILVQNGCVIVTDPVGNGEFAKVVSEENSKLYINGKEVFGTYKVSESDEIILKTEPTIGKRNITFKTNEDSTMAFISINYVPSFSYELIDCESDNILRPQFTEISGELPPLFKSLEIRSYLEKNGIVFGLIEKNISKAEESREIIDLCIAEGIEGIQSISDKIEILYDADEEIDNLEEMQNIDYKNLISIKSIKKGEVIAEIIKGRIGKEGVNVYGHKIVNNVSKELKFKIGSGCKLEGDKIIATIDGKPIIQQNTFSVNKLHIVNGDVDIRSGNIDFQGAVSVRGKVTEGMKIVCNSINVLDGSFKAEIIALENSSILGNIFGSKISMGGRNPKKEKKVDKLIILKGQLISILDNIKFLAQKNLIDEKITIGNLTKTLIDSKYTTIPRLCTDIIECDLDNEQSESVLSKTLKTKLVGSGPINIIEQSEIEEIVQSIENEIALLQIDLNADLKMEYCQESEINVIGNVLVIGKGSYTSKIFATENIEFAKDYSVCRGGYLKANKLIKVSSVGSNAEIETILHVEENGHIYAKVAYQNTIFIVGKTKYTLREDSRNVHVYKDKSGELIVDKLYL